MHLDVQLRDQAHRNGLIRLGATVICDHDRWRVLTDPEGNEFCAKHPTRTSSHALTIGSRHTAAKQIQ
jgi:hypothetical protein